jgi:hypothetical protein
MAHAGVCNGRALTARFPSYHNGQRGERLVLTPRALLRHCSSNWIGCPRLHHQPRPASPGWRPVVPAPECVMPVLHKVLLPLRYVPWPSRGPPRMLPPRLFGDGSLGLPRARDRIGHLVGHLVQWIGRLGAFFVDVSCGRAHNGLTWCWWRHTWIGPDDRSGFRRTGVPVFDGVLAHSLDRP